jgi:hypothetical protein
METLSKLFGSETKVKIMRLFLFNPDRAFCSADVADKTKASVGQVRKEIGHLEKAGLIKTRMPTNGSHKRGYILDRNFSYLLPLQNFLINAEPLQAKEVVKKITKLGSIKLIIIAGVFIQEAESRIDILVVGDHIKKASFENAIKVLESEIGKELRYAYFTTEDFQYRMSMFDKLIRDILDYPHRKILNKLGVV